MEVEPVIEWAGGVQRLADLLGITRQVVSSWRRTGWIPYLRACQVESVSRGHFKARKRGTWKQPNGNGGNANVTIEVQ